MTRPKKLAVIDGKSLFYRGYYAMPGLTLPDGTPTGGVYGFASIAIELIKKLEPDYVAVAWDKRHTNIRKRREIYPEYKAGRKKAPEDFYEQIPILYELLDAFGWPLYEIDDYEADDIMGAFAKEAEAKGIETYLLTSDLDVLQLVGPMVKVYALKNGLSNLEEFHVESFERKYGIRASQFLDLKALKGDNSDNLPGVPGIGEKTGISLLQKYQSLDGIYQHIDEIQPVSLAKKLKDGKESAYMTKKLASIWVDAPIKLDWEVADVNDTNLDKVEAILRRLEFASLIKRMPKHMSRTPAEALQIEKAKRQIVSVIDWPVGLSIDGPIMLLIEDDKLWLSIDEKTAFCQDISQIDKTVWAVLEMATVVGFDVKTVYHQLADRGVLVKFDTIHDINQAEFLLNPLSRDRSLSGILDEDVPNEPADQLSAMWAVYKNQKAALAREPKLASIAEEFDFPLIHILFKMERRGVKIDSKFLKNLSKHLGDEHAKLEQEMYKLVGHEFNIASPIQLSEVLFSELALPIKGIKKGKTGYSTGQKELDKLRGLHPIIELIEKTRELAKLKSTYVDALPVLADGNDRVHTTFNQDVAATGRLSSTNPNLQNIPIRTDLGREIRQAFRADDGMVLVSADYSQFELRLAAILAGDKQLIDNFKSGFDIHTKTASEIYNVPVDDVTKNQRRNAKVINFGVLYGMSPHGLSEATGMPFDEAKKFIDDYFDLRKPVRDFINETLDQARVKGYVETYYGRKRPTPDIHSSIFMVRSAAERAAANMPIQGTEADIMKRAMIKLDEKITGLGEQILQIHDSILVECPKDNAAKVAEIMHETLESVAPELAIDLNVEVHTGKDWSEL